MRSFVDYFQVADRNGDSVISGDEARQFFQVCSLPSSTLAKIWAVADHMVRCKATAGLHYYDYDRE